jgi:hypothetical protein
MNNPDNCPANQNKWSYGSAKKPEIIPYTPFEVSQMRNINPCSRCLSKKTCSYDRNPLSQTPNKRRGKPRINRVPEHKFQEPIKVAGQLLNTHKRQVGLKMGILTKKDGTPKTDNNGFEIRGLIKVQYVRTSDKQSPKLKICTDCLGYSTCQTINYQLPIACRGYTEKARP